MKRLVAAVAAVGASAGLVCSAPAGAAPVIACKSAPTAVVAMINAAFTDGEELVNSQSVDGPDSMTYIGGNIDKAGSRESSGDVWLLSDGVLYALSSDARRRTMLPDGRDLASAGDDYGSELINCVGRADSAG